MKERVFWGSRRVRFYHTSEEVVAAMWVPSWRDVCLGERVPVLAVYHPDEEQGNMWAPGPDGQRLRWRLVGVYTEEGVCLLRRVPFLGQEREFLAEVLREGADSAASMSVAT